MNPLAAIQAGLGAVQFIGGLLSKPKKRPEYTIAGEYGKNVKLAQDVKNMGMPAEEFYRQKNMIDRNMATGMSQLQGRRSALAGVTNMVAATNDANLNLNAQAANIKASNFRMGTQLEMGANSELANQKLQKMQWEKLQPYMDKMRKSEALMGAGMQNVMGGLKTGALLMEQAGTKALTGGLG